jgi:uncharacterized membrane protein YedE/YeeE
MADFTPIQSAVGGVLIGVAATGLLYFNGRIAGISGVVGSLLRPRRDEWAWRALFVLGLLAGGLLCARLAPGAFSSEAVPGRGPLVIAGLLVGFGTRLASGCTSGHGVCGLARRSRRSLVATVTFMAVAAAVVFVTRHVLGGGR